MAKINQIRRLAIIVSKLNSKHYVPAEELVDYVSYTIRARYSDTAGCTLRTLQRDFRTIEELFGVTIRHDKLCGYYIDERYGSAEDYEALLLNFELLNAIDSDSTIQKYLLPEHHRAIILPNIAELLDAIRNRHPVEFDYILVRHGGKVVRKCLHPYFLKESQQRWYLIGYDTDDKLKAFEFCPGSDLCVTIRLIFRHCSVRATAFGITQKILLKRLYLNMMFWTELLLRLCQYIRRRSCSTIHPTGLPYVYNCVLPTISSWLC